MSAHMSNGSTRSYLSIGEVLGLLLEEFPEVTISKIRFLESQGLIDPERTASGYRKFSPADVERLRFILREQREHFPDGEVGNARLSHRFARRARGGTCRSAARHHGAAALGRHAAG